VYGVNDRTFALTYQSPLSDGMLVKRIAMRFRFRPRTMGKLLYAAAWFLFAVTLIPNLPEFRFRRRSKTILAVSIDWRTTYWHCSVLASVFYPEEPGLSITGYAGVEAQEPYRSEIYAAS